MRSKVSLALLLLLSGVAGQSQNLASPYSNSVFPAQIFSTTKTGTPIQLNGLIVPSTVGSSFASGSITLTGTSLTTVTFAMQGSSDNGLTYYSLPIFTVATPTVTPTTTITATANGLYQVNLAGLTHVRFVTSGTFTATSINLVLTASPNAMVSRSPGGTGSGVTIDGQAGAFIFGGPGVSHSGTTYTFNAGSGGTPPAGSIQDNQFNAGGGALGADTGIYQYDSTTHTLKTRNLLPDVASLFMGLGNTVQSGKNNDAPGVICGNLAGNGTPCTTMSNQFYFQSKRTPGGSVIIPRHLDVEIQGGYENENNGAGAEFEAERLTYNQQSSGQAGGVSARFVKSTAPGDLVDTTLLMQGTGCNRAQDECLEPNRKFVGFLNPNFGGHVVKGSTFTTGDQPLQVTTGFGGYSTNNPGVDMLLVDATKRVSAGNVINTTSVDGGWLVEATLDTPHSFGVSTKTTLTHSVDNEVYTGSCPTVTDTGVTFPTAGPYAHAGDAFSTQENGTGLGTINGNYLNDTTNTLVGYCLRFNAVSVAPPVGTIMHIADQQATSEFVTVIASGTTWARAFVHHQHPTNAILTWGGGVGQGFGMAADEISPGSISQGYNFFGEGPQTSISKLIYPVSYTPDSTHVVFDIGSEIAGAEWRTRGFPSVTPAIPNTVTLTQSGGVVNSVSQSVNDYAAIPNFPGTSQELPPPAYTVAGCTVPPVLKFSLARVTGLSYTVSLVSGGSGCTGTPTVTLLPATNSAYFAPVAWIRNVVDTASCSSVYPFPCSSTDGYVLADSGAKSFSNGDEILESLNSGRYLTDQYNESGDPIVAHSGRNGPNHLRTHEWTQSGSPFQTEVDMIPSEFIYGSFANNWTPDPNIPRSASWLPGPFLSIAGVQNTYYDMLPPTAGGPAGGEFKSQNLPGQMNMGEYKFTFDCILSPRQTGTVDHPCLHGQYFPFGLAFNKIGSFPSGIYVQPADGTWHSTRGFIADGALSGQMLTLPSSFADLPSPTTLGLQNNNQYSIFSKSSVPNTWSSDAQVSAGEYTAGLVHAGANNYNVGVFPSWGSFPIGATNYSYIVTTVTGEGETTGVTTGFTGGPTSLDPVTNFIGIQGIFTGGAQSAKVYRTGGPGGAGFICSFTTAAGQNACNDTGQTANASLQPPTFDTSGSFQLANSQKMKSIHGNATQLQAQSGTSTPDHIVTYDSGGNIHDSTVNISAIGGGGATNPNTCTANTALDKCLGVSPYVAIAGDWSTAINQAMTDLASTGGTIYGCGTYPVNGPLLDTSGANALLKVPTIPLVPGGASITIQILGCQHTTPTPTTSSLSGMILQTSVDTAGGNFVGGQSAGNFTAVRLVMKHVNLISTHAVPNLNLFNASWLVAMSTEDVILSGTGCTAIPPSNVGGIGLQTPNLSNTFEVTIDKTVISCMPSAAILREHTQIGTLWLGSNHDCVTFDGGGTGSNSIQASMIWAQSCVNYAIGGAHSTGVNVSVFDMETDPGTGLDINDPLNLISGIIFYKKQSPSGSASISGGANLLACNLNAILGCFGGTASNPFLENWKSQDGSGTTLANTGSDSTNTMTATNVTWSTTVSGFAGAPVAVYNGTSSVSLAASATQTSFDGTTPFSACAWFNLSTLTFPTGTLANIMSNLSSASGNPGWRMGIFGTGASPVGSMDIYLANNVTTNAIHVTTNAAFFSSGAVQLGCFTYDGTKTAAGVIPYINGTAASTNISSDTLTGSMVSTSPLRISGEVTNANWFPGALGRVRVYNRKLSASEISSMFTAGPNAI